MPTAENAAHRIFEKHHGVLRTSEALRAGIHPRTLYVLRDRGEIEELTRGLFRLRELPPASAPDLLAVGKKVPRAVFCLLTALSFHGLTTQVPHEVHFALPRSARPPIIEYPPIRVFQFSNEAYHAGVEMHVTDGTPIRIYSKAKTLADAFKYRNKIGLDVVVEALRNYRAERNRDFDAVLRFARICRVENVIRPYIEAIL